MSTPLTPELLALHDLCARLDAARVAYMLTGSLAISYYAGITVPQLLRLRADEVIE